LAHTHPTEIMLGTSTTLDSEWQLLLTVCSPRPPHEKQALLRSLLDRPIQWESLFALAERHGIQPLLFQALASFADAIPPEEIRALRESYQTNLHKSLLLARELIRIVEHLSMLNLEVMPYKGLALAEVVYGDIARRQSGDIDLLIHAKDFPRICDAAGELGYAPQVRFSAAEERAYLDSGYECVFDGAAGRNLLEVQWAIQPRFYAVDFDMDGLFQRAITVTVAGQPMKTLCPADMLLVLAVHAAKHAWGRIIWLCDLARLINFPNLPWNWIAAQARSLGIMRFLRVTMLLANQLVETPIPAAAQSSFPDDPAAQTLANEIQTRIVDDNPCDVESLEYFRFMMRLRERPADRLCFLQRLVFTPGPSEWKAVRLPSSLFPLYRLVRFSRLAARLIRA
jgi:hypothetical protein